MRRRAGRGFGFGFAILADRTALFTPQIGAGAFYRLMPHAVMALLFGAAFLGAAIALAIGLAHFWHDRIGPAAALPPAPAIRQALKDAGRLRYLEGGGAGCGTEDERPADRRRLYHHFTFYGFLLCFVATAVATLYHFLLGRQAPYPWYDLPVLLGTLGGIGLVIGPLGLLAAQRQRSLDLAFLAMLLLASLSGLALLLGRDGAAMGALLALHLGIVFSLFVTMPYSKFVHGLYRFAALVRYAQERRGSVDDSRT